MKTSSTKAPSASSNSKPMQVPDENKPADAGPSAVTVDRRAGPRRGLRAAFIALIVGSLAGCAVVTGDDPGAGPPEAPFADGMDDATLPAPIVRGKSLWTPTRWSELPGWGSDSLHEAWNAWLKTCEKTGAPATPGSPELCRQVRQLSIATPEQQRDWVQRRFVPYRITEPDGRAAVGLLTGYYEPVLEARRLPDSVFRVPLHAEPQGLPRGQPWYTRQQIDTQPVAQRALEGRVIAWLADPIDAMILQIQGSGRLTITEPDGRQRQVRLAFAAHNGHTYRSPVRWLLDQGAIREGHWAAVRAWARRHPQRVNDMMWSNPRTVFFREEALDDFDAKFGPRGAQGVPLTPGRSIAVDPHSIPYGTPVWLVTQGPTLTQQKLVLAQDTGGAILGAVRADLFTGWGGFGDPAYTIAAGLNQPLQLWALWPK
ncbi:MAG TPA: transglycosylase [Comamonadaceae bacterium]|nr:transglycosylase [Comamonadaceae bacterium]